MKSERRRKLEKNDLAGWLEIFFEKTKEYHTAIIYSICGLILLIVIVNVYSAIRRSSQGRLWDAYSVAQDEGEEALNEFAAQNRRSLPGALASLEAGNAWLSQGITFVQTGDVEAAADALGKAGEAFGRVQNFSSPDQRQLAFLGLGKVSETLASVEKPEENLKEAAEFYSKAVTPEGPVSLLAQESLKDVSRPEMLEICLAVAARPDPAAVDAQMDAISQGLSLPDTDVILDALPEGEVESALQDDALPAEALPVESVPETAPVE